MVRKAVCDLERPEARLGENAVTIGSEGFEDPIDGQRIDRSGCVTVTCGFPIADARRGFGLRRRDEESVCEREREATATVTAEERAAPCASTATSGRGRADENFQSLGYGGLDDGEQRRKRSTIDGRLVTTSTSDCVAIATPAARSPSAAARPVAPIASARRPSAMTETRRPRTRRRRLCGLRPTCAGTRCERARRGTSSGRAAASIGSRAPTSRVRSEDRMAGEDVDSDAQMWRRTSAPPWPARIATTKTTAATPRTNAAAAIRVPRVVDLRVTNHTTARVVMAAAAPARRRAIRSGRAPRPP